MEKGWSPDLLLVARPPLQGHCSRLWRSSSPAVCLGLLAAKSRLGRKKVNFSARVSGKQGAESISSLLDGFHSTPAVRC